MKRGAESSTDYHQVVCSLQFWKLWLNRKSNGLSVAYRIKWEALEDREVRKQFASNVSNNFRQLADAFDDIEKEWQLFKSEIISSAAKCCARKRLKVTAIVRKKHLGVTKRLEKLFEKRNVKNAVKLIRVPELEFTVLFVCYSC